MQLLLHSFGGSIAYKLSVQFTLAKHFDVSKPFPWEELLRTSPNAAAAACAHRRAERAPIPRRPGAAKVPRVIRHRRAERAPIPSHPGAQIVRCALPRHAQHGSHLHVKGCAQLFSDSKPHVRKRQALLFSGSNYQHTSRVIFRLKSSIAVPLHSGT